MIKKNNAKEESLMQVFTVLTFILTGDLFSFLGLSLIPFPQVIPGQPDDRHRTSLLVVPVPEGAPLSSDLGNCSHGNRTVAP